MACHTSIVFARNIILKWLRRNAHGDIILGDMFYLYLNDVRDKDLLTKLQSLIDLFMENLKTNRFDHKKENESQILYWISQQTYCIKALFFGLCRES